MPLRIVFSRSQKLVSTKTQLLKHYYRRQGQSSVTPLLGRTKARETLVLLCFGAIREGLIIRDRSLLTS